jgi:hypothetical protein
MTRDQLIAALQAMPDNDEVLLDINGRFTTDYTPERRVVTATMLKNTETFGVAKPKLGAWVILL